MSATTEIPTSRTAQAVLGAIRGEIPAVTTSPLYQLGLAVVALAMVILPLIYVSLIGLVAYGVFWHATHNVSVFQHARGKGAMIGYLGPMAAGGILLFFMIKPLFAPRGKQQKRHFLKRKAEPLLFEYVDRLCSAVHAPQPRRICVDCEVNASAGFSKGFWSMLGSDLTLTIGLPLAAGLSLRQLSGVLAHEFGHFSQGAGMRLSYIIRSVNVWFVRVVYERDAWDEQLVEWSNQGDGTIVVILWVTRFFIWLTRRILWVLMMLGHVINCFMMRQMEFDADRHEARLAGSDAFESTSRRLRELSVANQMAMVDLRQFFSDGRLADDLPSLILANVAQITPELRNQLETSAEQESTGLFDTHPATKDRIANSRREATTGLYRLAPRTSRRTHPSDEARATSVKSEKTAGMLGDGEPAGDDLPAAVLFSQFDTLCRTVTQEYYESLLDRPVRPEELQPVGGLLGQQGVDDQALKALHRFFQGQFCISRPLPLPDGDIPEPANENDGIAESVRRAREAVLARLESYRNAIRAHNDADARHVFALQAASIAQAEIKFNPADFKLQNATFTEAQAAARATRAEMKEYEAELSAFEADAAKRFFGALDLLRTSGLSQQLEDGDSLQEEAESLIPVARLTTGLCGGVLHRLWNLRAQLMALFGCANGNEQHEGLKKAIFAKLETVHTDLQELQESLGSVPYPFEHGQAGITISQHAIGAIPDAGDLGGMAGTLEQAIDRLCSLHLRLYARLARAAEQIEAVLGLPPLPEPVKDAAAEE